MRPPLARRGSAPHERVLVVGATLYLSEKDLAADNCVGVGQADRLQAGRVSMAGPYGPTASDVFHKYLNNQSLVPNQGLDSADPGSIPLLLLPQLWRGGGGCEGTSPSGIGTRHAVAFSGRGGSGSRRVSGSGTAAQPESAPSVVTVRSGRDGLDPDEVGGACNRRRSAGSARYASPGRRMDSTA